MLPNTLIVTIPTAVLAGILLGLSRLAADSEITAMRASGIGALSFVRIVSILSFAALALGLVNTLYFAPRGAADLLRLEDELKSSQASFEVQPRVFYEDFKNYVLYTQDVLPGANGTAIWKHVFLADLTQPATPHIISAQEAIVQAGGDRQTLRLDLLNGSRHDIAANDPTQYDIAKFDSTVLPIETNSQEDTHLSRRDTPMQALDTAEVWRRAHGSSNNTSDTRPYAIEFHRRLSFPTACLVLMLVGVPLGLASKRGGKGSGFAVTLLLVFLYYFLSEIGVALAQQQKLPAFAGVWGANLLFAIAGILLIQQMARGGVALNAFSSIGNATTKFFERLLRLRPSEPGSVGAGDRLRRLRRAVRSRFPLILDEYAMGNFLRNFFLVLCVLTVLFIIFTFFELIGDIIKYRTPLVTVGDYLINLIPFILYNVTPLCSLVAVLVTFGALSRSSEITAMKASGVSLYRIVTPVLLVAAILSALLFAFDESYLPAANRRQEALLSSIKGKPAQTFLRPDRKWISGQPGNSGEPTRIFYYQAFDPYRNVFANITVFEFEPGSFILSRRIYAESAHWDAPANHWDFENGWERAFANGDTVTSYHAFQQASFSEIHETPGYFKKEERPSQEMSYSELSAYIRDLQQSGFDTTPLRVQLNRKLSYPLLTLVMAILAVPFSLAAGKRGSLAGIGAALALAIGYWVLAGISENLGNVNSLPAVLAAWSPDLLFAMAGSYLLLRTPT
jgi:LPS export ABC transporter permease LptG/LPS export ABC transporter permease LptF